MQIKGLACHGSFEQRGLHKEVLRLLNDSQNYTKLKKDPFAEYKNELIIVLALKEMKKRAVISVELHIKKLYPTCDLPPRFYGLPKLH